MPSRERRRFKRYGLSETVRVSWVDAAGRYRFVNAKCLDVSQTGMRVELPHRLDENCYVNLRMDRYRFNSSAKVRHVSQKGLVYEAGLEFNGVWRWKDLENIVSRQPEFASA